MQRMVQKSATWCPNTSARAWASGSDPASFFPPSLYCPDGLPLALYSPAVRLYSGLVYACAGEPFSWEPLRGDREGGEGVPVGDMREMRSGSAVPGAVRSWREGVVCIVCNRTSR
jgi:hypothetical protein